MSEHTATLTWKRDTEDFAYKTYSRAHAWDFGNGHTVQASAAADFLGDPSLVDPEQAYVASLSSCHMLTFLAFCALQKLTVDSYTDKAVGHLEKDPASGKPVITRVELNPEIQFAPGIEVDRAKLEELHHKAHEECFLANSVKTEIVTNLG